VSSFLTAYIDIPSMQSIKQQMIFNQQCQPFTFILMLRYATYGFAGFRYGCTGANGTCPSVDNDESFDTAAAAATAAAVR